MPTFLEQFADAEIKVRYKEPLLTAGLDQMLTGITPQGVHRGFRLGANIGNLKVTVEADPADNDHIAAYTTDDGYTLRLRRTGGDFDLDLSPFINKEVVIAIFAEYGTGVTTFAEIRAYEYDPADEFTGAAERGELVVFGKVTVPAAGVIPATDIDPTFRTLAWDHVGSDAAPWEQVIENGSFELAADATTFVAADRGFVPHWDTQYIPPQHTWEIDSVNPHTGRYCLKMTGSGVASLSVAPPDRIVAVQPGQLIRVSYWIRGENWPAIGAGGTMGLQLNFYGPNLSLVAFRVVQDKSLTGTFGWTQLDEYIEVPAGVAWLVPAITVLDSPVAGVTAALAFDDIRVWMSKGPPTIPFSSVQDGLTNGGHIVGQLGIAETNVTQFGATQFLDTFVKGILQLHKLDNVAPSLNRYKWGRLDDEAFALFMQEGVVHLAGLNATADEASIARFKAEFGHYASASYYTLLNHWDGPGTADQIRTYITNGASIPSGTVVPAVLTTFNCYWDESTLRWIADSPGSRAGLHIVNEQGGVGNYQMEGANTVAPWTTLDWVNGTALIAWETPLLSTNRVDGKTNDFRLTINNPSTTFSNLAPTADPTDGNTLQAKNIVKAWARVVTNIGAIPDIRGGFNILSTTTYPLSNVARIPFRYTLDLSDYCAVGSVSGGAGDIVNVDVTQGYVDLEVRDHAGAALDVENVYTRDLSVIVMGQIS